jgi:RNA polymerase sigma factor (TIGR02999 family)
MMRRVLVDHARTRQRLKRGGPQKKPHQELEADRAAERGTFDRIDVLALDEALTKLAQLHERHEKVVELRFFGGLSVEETAAALGVSTRTVEDDWAMSRVWLKRELSRGANPE